jgi:hypothetical protein
MVAVEYITLSTAPGPGSVLSDGQLFSSQVMWNYRAPPSLSDRDRRDAWSRAAAKLLRCVGWSEAVVCQLTSRG